jgi:hypothetical protein
MTRGLDATDRFDLASQIAKAIIDVDTAKMTRAGPLPSG